MIFVILGTQKFQLNRLLKQLDELIDAGIITDEVVAQVGNSTYQPVNFKYYKFMDKESFDNTVKSADIVIAHSGVGSIITALKANKPVIVFPRLAKYKEHVDDHQLDIASAFEKKNYVLCCYEGTNISDKIKECVNHKFNIYESEREHMIDVVNDYLNSL